MGRKSRHSARTGDGGAELRLKKKQLQAAERAQKDAELEFYDNPSEDENDSEAVDSDGSEYGEEQEVLQLGEDEDSDSEDEGGEHDEGEDKDDDFDGDEERKKILQMDGKWGKSKKNFYSADTAEYELDSDEEAAKDEEEAALELQRKQAEMMDEEDFGIEEHETDDQEDDDDNEEAPVVDDEDLVGEQLADISMLMDNGSGGASIEQVHRDFSKMSKKEKLQIVNQSAPELLGLMSELDSTMKDLNEVVTPAIKKLSAVRRKTKAFNTGLQYLITRQNLMLNYVANISFYMLLRAEGKSVVDHPVLQHLLVLKKQMNKIQSLDEALNPQLQDLLTKTFPMPAENDGMDKFFDSTATQQKKQKRAAINEQDSASKKQKKSTPTSSISATEKAEADEFYAAAAREKAALKKSKHELYTYEKPTLQSSDDDSDLEETGGKRGATYEIMTNKGLKAHKNKLNRNPRVKKRMQYRKAVIRRKGQVRDVRVGEAGKYGGETTGIKSNLTRSRKIRN